MAFTEHRFSREQVKEVAAQLAANLQAKRGPVDFLEFATGVIADRLARDRTSYRWYGPWWWSLKEVLRRAGHDYGTQSDPLVRRAYGFPDDTETLVAADSFRNWYMATQFIGSARFHLDPSTAEHYALWDADMEDPAAAP
ncbi:MAG TPA: hypothetical protein VIG97_11535 [Luteimonas sp.]